MFRALNGWTSTLFSCKPTILGGISPAAIISPQYSVSNYTSAFHLASRHSRVRWITSQCSNSWKLWRPKRRLHLPNRRPQYLFDRHSGAKQFLCGISTTTSESRNGYLFRYVIAVVLMGGSIGGAHQIFNNNNDGKNENKSTIITNIECEAAAEDEGVVLENDEKDSQINTDSLTKSDKEPDVKKITTSHILSTIWNHLKKHKLLLFGVLVATIATAGVNLMTPLVIGELTAAIQYLVTIKETSGLVDLSVLKVPGLKLFALFSAQGTLTALTIYLTSKLGETLASSLRINAFKNLLTQDVTYFDSHLGSDVSARINADIQDLKHIFKLALSQGLKHTIHLLGATATLFQISPILASSLLTATPVLYLTFLLYGSYLRKLSRRSKTHETELSHITNEAISGIRVVKAFNGEETELSEFESVSQTLQSTSTTLGLHIGIFQGLTNMLLGMLLLSILYFGGSLVGVGKLSAGKLMTFLVTTQNSTKALSSLGSILGQLSKSASSATRVVQLLQARPSIGRGEAIYKGQPISSKDETLKGTSITFKDVSFAYPSRPSVSVLTDFTLDIPAGKVVALVGQSGSGKSTIAALINRFYDVNHGSVLINGRDIREWDLKSWRSHVGYITQEPILFSGTILSNVLYGRPSATLEEVEDACKKANCWEFIQKLPDGLWTRVGERGVELSGGERQRIAIARCFLKDPSVLVLDEATSALDNTSESLITDSLSRLISSKNRTTIVIAHRLSTIQKADTIVVMDKNKGVIEMGNHDELLKKRGAYYNFWKLGGERHPGEWKWPWE